MTDKKDIPSILTPQLEASLNSLGVATITAQLQRRGIRSTFFSGLKVMHPEQRMVGRARTLRYVALREDVQPQYQSGFNAQKQIVEATEAGDVIVIEARGVADAATMGDIMATRHFALGGRGIVTDGGVRDTTAIHAIGKPVYHLSSHGAVLGREHMPFSIDEPITCAGVFVVPGDVIVGDGEGAVVIPINLVEDVVADALAQEEKEEFALEKVQAGETTVGIFPLAKDREAEFEAWRKKRN